MKKAGFLLFLICCGMLSYCQPYWKPVASGTFKDLLSISFGSATTGYIGGKDSLMLKTTDAGATWQVLPLAGIFSPSRKDIVAVDFVSANVGYITVAVHPQSYNSRVYKTTDGGNSWTWLLTGDAVPLRCHFFTEGNGYIAGSTFYKGYAVDKVQGGALTGGKVFSANPYLFFRAIDFRNQNMGLVAGDSGLVARTFNSGADWDTLRIPDPATVHALAFLNDSTVMAATDNSGATLLISTDTGRTWVVDYASLTFDYPVMNALVRSSKDSFVAVGTSATTPGKGTIYWHDHTFNRFQHVDQPLYGVAMRDDSIAYAVGANGLIVTNAISTPLDIANKELLASLKVYPNPAENSCTIELPVKHRVKVYDMNGRLIVYAANPALVHKIDLTNRARGIYLLEIMTEQGTLTTNLVLR